MATKKERRTSELKSKKQKKTMRTAILALIVVCLVGFLIFFFITLFDFIFPPKTGKDSVAKSREKVAVMLYFSDINERFLLPEKRFVPKENDAEKQAEQIIKALIAGSKTNLVNTFPEKTELLDVKIDLSKTARISFTQNLINMHPGGSASEMATLFSLTNSLTGNIPQIEGVKVLIDGKEVPTLKGHIDTRQTFRLNKDILAPGT
jgi:flagellar basal body-associated protein FliL